MTRDARHGARRIVVLAGGIGAARFLRGLVAVTRADEVTVVGNTGDDIDLHGLRVSPDLDTIAYTIGGGVHPEQGWGRADESRTVATELADTYGEPAWFTLGDRDLATHLLRTGMLAAGATMTEVTARVAGAWELPLRLLPMTDDRVTTVIDTVDGRSLHFQRWWVGERAKPDVRRVRFVGADAAVPAPGVLDALADADLIVIAPSNPVVSVGPVLAVPGIRAAVAAGRVVGVSPIVGGRVVRGMADRLLPVVGVEVSAVGVARLYAGLLDGWVVDAVDAEQRGDVEALGIEVATTDTVMDSPQVAASVARTVLRLGLGPPDRDGGSAAGGPPA